MQSPFLPLPTSESDFQIEISKIDNELRLKGVSIHARSLHAATEYARRFGVEFPIPPSGSLGTEGDYTGISLGRHIMTWYEKRYGDRQKSHMGPGSTIISLRGDPWELRLPLILGQVTIVVERDLNKYANAPNITTSGVHPTYNILTSICDFPNSLALSLTDIECEEIARHFILAMNCYDGLNEIIDLPYITEVLSDISSAVAHVFSAQSHAGLSKWSSAQAGEKLLKSFLKVREIDFPKTHNLNKLHLSAQQNGLEGVSEAIISALQTNPSVRYGDELVSLPEAIKSHIACLELGRILGKLIRVKKIVDIIKGFNLAADRNGSMMVMKFDLGNMTKTFLFRSASAKFILAKAKINNEIPIQFTRPEISADNWNGAITPVVTSMKVDEFDDIVTITVELSQGKSDGLAFNKSIWRSFIENLRQYESHLI
jgi:HEPN domain-containing protein